ncbi:MAG: HypC/HybG/HupF family hydrogenase formation chaperone [Deltaproteobacteria bacterium]|nr:HypC/HybG/HupF family hydrogenase formation chaperone [Deltaproteobacteria bacterium]MBZ0219403.1 HypC/HybG/HupF family hydrogenase formation chaperone [Deltaproteobacteria bacterium]
MCLGIPGRIIDINGFVARVDVAGATKEADLRLMQEARPGDFVIIHAGFAIEKVDEAKARETLDLIRAVSKK